jgi:glucokinase
MPTYQVQIKGTATVIRLYEVKARSKKEAKELGWKEFTSLEEPVDQIIEYNEDDEVVDAEKI